MASPFPLWLTRKQAAAYLAQAGFRITTGTLANKAANNNAGKGPPFERHGWKSVMYNRDELDTWRRKETQRVE